MSIPIETIQQLDIFFDAGENVPAPYHNAYHLQLTLKPGGIQVDFDLRYLHREELTEEDILDEGFTLNDDWNWQGALPDIWQKALFEQLQKSIWPNKPKEAQEDEAVLEIQLLGETEEELFNGRPADPLSWEYFLQEMIQAIYEVARKEAPFALQYKEISAGKQHIDIWLEASFAERNATARQQGLPGKEVATISWSALKKLLKTVYMPEYNFDDAMEEAPQHVGKYVSTGDGLWYVFGESLLEPGADTNSLERLETALKELF